MKFGKKLLNSVLLIASLPLLAEPPLMDGEKITTKPKRLEALISSDTHLGSGEFKVRSGGKTTNYAIAKPGGLEGMAFVLHGKLLKEAEFSDLKEKLIVQVTLGQWPKMEDEAPSFHPVTQMSFIADTLPTKTEIFTLEPVTQAKKLKPHQGLVLWNNSGNFKDRTDEEKLKSSFFGEKGSVLLSLKGEPQIVEVKSQDKWIALKSQMLRMEFVGAIVGSPFNTEKLAVNGTIEIPAYWPSEKESEKWARQIASDNFVQAPVPLGEKAPEGINHHSPQLKGSSKNTKLKN